MIHRLIALCAVLLFACYESKKVVDPIRIGSFNIRTFGQSKMNKPHVMNIITEIIRRYDIILIVEVRDPRGKVIPKLLSLVNKDSKHQYDFVISNPLGRGGYKEQCAYIYRKDSARVKTVFDYKDTADEFERPPYVVQFQLLTANIDSITLVGLHLKPDKVRTEMAALPGAVARIKRSMGVQDILIAGDLNCDCGYIRPHEFEALELYTNSDYKWMIDWCQGRTMVSTWCRYDRLIATGSTLISKGIVNNSGDVYDFAEVYGLNVTQAFEVSDHRPVELQIRGKGSSRSRRPAF